MKNKSAIVFPGQGSQSVGMARDFFENFREIQLLFEEASDAAGINLRKLCFDGPLTDLTLTENLQPALFTTEAALWTGLQIHYSQKNSREFLPKCFAGHSLGEYSALYASGALSLFDSARLTRLRGQCMQKAVPVGIGAMAAIMGVEGPVLERLCKTVSAHFEGTESVEIANYNSPNQTVVSGTKIALERLSQVIQSTEELKKIRVISLPVTAPFHCRLMEPAREEMKPALLQTTFQEPKAPYVANLTAATCQSSVQIPGLLLDQITNPVLWTQTMHTFTELEIEDLIEVGPGQVLTGLMKRTYPQIKCKNINSLKSLMETFT